MNINLTEREATRKTLTLYRTGDINILTEEGCWEYNPKYIEQNCFGRFLSMKCNAMQWTNMGLLKTVPYAMIVRRLL